MAEDQQSQGWWHTIPGLLTAVAAIITAVSGLVVALYQAGFFDEKEQLISQAPDTTVTAPKPPSSKTPEKADAPKKADVEASVQLDWELFKEAYRYASLPWPTGMNMPRAEAQEFALKTVNCLW